MGLFLDFYNKNLAGVLMASDYSVRHWCVILTPSAPAQPLCGFQPIFAAAGVAVKLSTIIDAGARRASLTAACHIRANSPAAS
jgi:hypothetical protein